MNSYKQNEILLNVLQSFGGLKKSVQDFQSELVTIENKLDLIFDNADAKANSIEPAVHTNAAVANGRKLDQKQLTEINKDSFDVILDMATHILKFRKNPVKHTKLEINEMKKIGPHYMRIFSYMLEHPGEAFHSANIYKTYSSVTEIKEPNTFTKTIGALRRTLGQKDTSGPYIIKEFDWNGITNSKRGYVYKINPMWHYLVIHYTDKISEQFPA